MTNLNQDNAIKELDATKNSDTGWSTKVTDIMDKGLHSTKNQFGAAAVASAATQIPIGALIPFAGKMPSN